MIALTFTLLLPVLGALLLAGLRSPALSGWVNVLFSLLGFSSAVWLALVVLDQGAQGGGQFYIDHFNVYLIALTAFVGFSTAIFSRPYMYHEIERGRVTPLRLRLYHSSYQGFQFAMLLALSTNNLGILWFALEGATLATVLPVFLVAEALRRIGANHFALIGAVGPVTTAIAGALGLEEPFTVLQVAGGLVVIFGVLLVSLKPAPPAAGPR